MTSGPATRFSLRPTWRWRDVSDLVDTTSIPVTQPRPGASWCLSSCPRSPSRKGSLTLRVDMWRLKNISHVDVVAMSQKIRVQITKCFCSLSVAVCVTITMRETRVCHVDGDGIVTAARVSAQGLPTPRVQVDTSMTISTRVAVSLFTMRLPLR